MRSVSLRSTTIDHLLLGHLTDTSQRNGQSCEGRRGVATYNINSPLVARLLQALIESVQVLDLKPFSQADADSQLTRRTVHGKDIVDRRHNRLVGQMLHVDVGQVKLDALHEELRGDERQLIATVDHRTIVAWPHQGRGIVCGKPLGQSIDQTKLPYLVDFHFCFIYTYIYFSLYII